MQIPTGGWDKGVIFMAIVQQEPFAVWKYFEELCAIPHGSGNTAAVSQYCMDFAKAHHLQAKQDKSGNVRIQKPATPGYEHAPVVMIQGHLDMVCEKEADCDLDMEKEGLRLCCQGDYLLAEGTTLGGDDGIAVAYALAVLAAEDLPHPALEAVFTVDEEIGMLGAEALDLSDSNAKRLLNIDSEQEGVILAGCAGGLTATCRIPAVYESAEGEGVRICISGLQGGHSGMEIEKGHANSNILMGRFLHTVSADIDLRLAALAGGAKDNAIPRETTALCRIPAGKEEALTKAAAEFQAMCRHEFAAGDPEITVTVTPAQDMPPQTLTAQSTKTCIFALYHMPNGVQSMSADMPGMVETSLNLGVLTLDEAGTEMRFCVRSAIETAKHNLTEQMIDLCRHLGGDCEISGDYPAWEYQQNSPLQKIMLESYRTLYGKEPKLESVHAGLECGLLTQKIPGLDAISFGPDILDIHTAREKLSIPSVQRTWALLCLALKNCKD